MNRSVRSSRVTGPKMRVPIGSSFGLSRTAGVRVEAHLGAVVPADALARAHDDGVVDLAFLHASARRRILDRHLDDVADVRVPALRAASTLMHMTRRAPVLSATSSTDCIWIMVASPT
jgi:hypothetical protein